VNACHSEEASGNDTEVNVWFRVKTNKRRALGGELQNWSSRPKSLADTQYEILEACESTQTTLEGIADTQYEILEACESTQTNKIGTQQIAAWKLLYRVQHPARYVSRLQTIPSSDIELEFYP
jgi:hypothetical protein